MDIKVLEDYLNSLEVKAANSRKLISTSDEELGAYRAYTDAIETLKGLIVKHYYKPNNFGYDPRRN